MSENELRQRLCAMMGIPAFGTAPKCEKRGIVKGDGYVCEKWIYESEPGSWVTAVLYLPETFDGKLPALITTNGHGYSKSTYANLYAGPLYARHGIACLCTDPIGEEERHITGGMGTRAHDDFGADAAAARNGRLILGKIVFDCLRGVDFLNADPRIDSAKLGVAGVSLGGATAEWLTALDERLSVSLICGWGLMEYTEIGKLCTEVPFTRLKEVCSWPEFINLFEHSACLFQNGTSDTIMDPKLTGNFIKSLREGRPYVEKACGVGRCEFIEIADGGHRPYYLNTAALRWLKKHWQLKYEIPGEITYGAWLNENGLGCPPTDVLYWNALHIFDAVLADSGAKPLTREELACLYPDEIGQDRFTQEGWLKLIER